MELLQNGKMVNGQITNTMGCFIVIKDESWVAFYNIDSIISVVIKE